MMRGNVFLSDSFSTFVPHYALIQYVHICERCTDDNTDKWALWNIEQSSISWEPVDIFRVAVSNEIHIVSSSSSVGIGFQYKVASAHLGTLGTQQLPDQTRRADQIFATSVCSSESPMIGIGGIGSYCCFLPFLIVSLSFFVILSYPCSFLGISWFQLIRWACQCVPLEFSSCLLARVLRFSHDVKWSWSFDVHKLSNFCEAFSTQPSAACSVIAAANSTGINPRRP